MCGIAGLLKPTLDLPDAQEREALQAMARALAHRGPDGARVVAMPGAGLVHTRLAIIDVAGGDQPLGREGGRRLVGNGEIYNYRELRSDPLLAGRLATGSDFEPLLPLLDDRGAEACHAARGMFAMASVTPDGHAVLARDPFGIKPLYLARRPGVGHGALLFASEPRALLAAGVQHHPVDPLRLRILADLNYIPGSVTPWPGITRLPPGTALTVERGEADRELRLAPLPVPADTLPPPRSEDEALAGFEAALLDSVALHLRSDVGAALFLSGGIDSAALGVAIRRLGGSVAGAPVAAYTCGFSSPDAADERARAAAVARALGFDHRPIELAPDDLGRLAVQAAHALDDPTTDYATLPSLALAEAARRDGVKVALSGEGGDELFAGYGRYRRALRPRWLGGRAASPGVLAGLGLLPPVAASFRAREAATFARTYGARPLAALRAGDIATWLPADLLLKLDRCLMAAGVEGRTPFLDPAMARFAWSLPDEMLIRGRLGKWLVRRWLAGALPEAAALAPKQGFTVPVGAWLETIRRPLAELLPRSAGARLVLPEEALRRLLGAFRAKEHGQAVWNLVFVALWHRIHVEGAAPEGDALALLAG